MLSLSLNTSRVGGAHMKLNDEEEEESNTKASQGGFDDGVLK